MTATMTALEKAIEAAAQEISAWYDSGDRILSMYSMPEEGRNPEIAKRIKAIIWKHLGRHDHRT